MYLYPLGAVIPLSSSYPSGISPVLGYKITPPKGTCRSGNCIY